MTLPEVPPVAHVELLDGGVVLTFGDGDGAFLSADVMHHAVSEAKELPEFVAKEAQPVERSESSD